MSEILDDLRQHLIDNGIVESKQCKKNFADDSPELICLWVYGGYSAIVGQIPTVQIKSYSLDNVTAEERIQAIFDLIISGSPNRISTINGRKMKIVESYQPVFVEKDTQGRFIWAFNVTITAF